MKTSQLISTLGLTAIATAAPALLASTAEATPAVDLGYLIYTAYGTSNQADSNAKPKPKPKLMVKRVDADGAAFEAAPAVDLGYLIYTAYGTVEQGAGANEKRQLPGEYSYVVYSWYSDEEKVAVEEEEGAVKKRQLPGEYSYVVYSWYSDEEKAVEEGAAVAE